MLVLWALGLGLGLGACRPGSKAAKPAAPAKVEVQRWVQLEKPEDIRELYKITLVMHSVLTGKDEVLTIGPGEARLTGGHRNVDAKLPLNKGDLKALYADLVAVADRFPEYPQRKEKRVESHITIQGLSAAGRPFARRFKVDYRGTSGKMYYRLKSYRDRIMREVLSAR